MPNWIHNLFGRSPPSETQQLREEIERQSLRLEKQLLDSQLQLQESTQLNYYDQAIDPREPLFDSQDFWLPVGYAEHIPINLNNRLRGEVLPVYLTWYGLKIIRDQSRKLCAWNEFAVNAVENRISYIVGKGMTYRCVRKHATATPEGRKDPLAAACQDVIDEFIDANGWHFREQEGVKRFDRDGEAFFRLFHVGNGRSAVRSVEPELVYNPADVQNTSFGIKVAEGDIEDVEAYYVVEDPANHGYNAVEVPAEEIVHIKANVDSTAKRGLPTFFPVRKNLDRADKLLRNMSTLAQVQATFALIRKHKRASAAAVNTFQQANRDVTITTPVTGRTVSIQKYQPGSILDTDADTEYEFPSGTVNAAALVEILQAELRAIAARLVMPEYMLTGDASNANFASTLVSESPSVKNFERLQALFARHYGDGGYRGDRHSGVMWRVLSTAVQWGRLPPEALTEIEIQVEGPSLVVRDKKQETNRAKELHDAGLLSKHTWASWENLDYDQEQEKQKSEPKPVPPGGDFNPLGGPPPGRTEPGETPKPAPPGSALAESFDSSKHPRGQPGNAGQFGPGGGGKGHGPGGDTAGEGELPDGSKVKFVPHPNQSDEETTVMVDAAKLDAGWSKDGEYYVPFGEERKPGARANVEAFLRKGEPVEAPRVTVDADGTVSFTDGRHRFAVLRDLGVDRVAVTIEKSQLQRARQILESVRDPEREPGEGDGVRQPVINVNVSPPSVTVHNTTVDGLPLETLAEKIGASAAEAAVKAHVKLMEQEQPPAPPPEIHVHVPEQAPTVVNVAAPIVNVPAAQVTVNVPPPEPRTVIFRGEDGSPTGRAEIQ